MRKRFGVIFKVHVFKKMVAGSSLNPSLNIGESGTFLLFVGDKQHRYLPQVD
jgi:hypothetical protein